MAGNIGFYTRKTRKLNVNTGSRLTDVSKLTRALPNADGVSYWSGEALWVTSEASVPFTSAGGDKASLDETTYLSDGAVKIGTAANNGTNPAVCNPNQYSNYVDAAWRWTTTPIKGTPVYFAFQDSDEWDGSGKNMAVASIDKFEIQTPFFDTSKAYYSGMPLTVKSVTVANLPKGNRPRGASVSDPNTTAILVTPAGDTDDIIGYVTAGVVKVTGKGDVTVAEDPTTHRQYIAGGPSVWTESSLTERVLQFETAFEKAKAADAGA